MSDSQIPTNSFDSGPERFSSNETRPFLISSGERLNVSYVEELGKRPVAGNPAPYWYPAPGLPIGILVCFGPTKVVPLEDNHSFTEPGQYMICFNLFKELETSVGLLFAGRD